MKSEHLLPVGVVLSLVLSFIAVFRSYPLSHGLDYISLIFTALTILVAVLIGFQVVQYVFIEKKMKELAEQAALKSTQSFKEDLKIILQNFPNLVDAKLAYTFNVVPKAFHYYLYILEQYEDIKDEDLREKHLSSLLQEFLSSVEAWKAAGKLQIFSNQYNSYLDFLGRLDSPQIARLKELLATAERVNEIEKTFSQVNLR